MKDAPPSSDSQQTQSAEDDDDDVVGCLPRLLSNGHREIIESIVHSLPETVAQGKQDTLEVDRKHLLSLVPSVREAMIIHFPLKKSEKDSLTRKVFIKMVQRLALVVLKPRLAAWRYRRGRRRLEENLKNPKANGSDFVTTQHCSNNNNLGADDICMEEDEDDHPDEVAFPIVQQALFYEEPMGRHAFGSNVRDAACYVLWAFARAYEPDELKTFIDSVATSLMCVALFDREVNLRRAASAAFQENVGRQANFPDGIALLTTVDYFTVGNRWRCYTKACLEVIRFPKYADAIVDHLVESKVLLSAIELPSKLRAESEKLKISGGELTRLALATFIRCLSSVPIALGPETIEKWQDRLLIFACDDTAAVRSAAAAAASAFFPAYFSDRVSASIDVKIESIPTKILAAKRENERIGLCLVVAFLPRRFISSLLVDAICTVIVKRSSLDGKWALARRSAVDALGEIFASRPCAEWISPVFNALFCAVEDYTTDCHGDIGRFTACKCIKTLLYSKITRQHISHADELSAIYRDEQDFIQDSVFLSITPLLLCEEYYTDLICGLVISAGGVSEGTTMRASQALMEYQLSTSKNLKVMNASI
ncbi:hypothetical protein TELCIR_08184 [Teladorsagia circumcincta]|uniref:Tubulin-specific chaperone D n=1 Tax=Teladorsagia circumcincta TaxID=45464 RepID=A0A2G9UIB0_TELCI|nr:hypothetical protein TELCIR_08184 [Teladorsagia circumcincta]